MRVKSNKYLIRKIFLEYIKSGVFNKDSEHVKNFYKKIFNKELK